MVDNPVLMATRVLEVIQDQADKQATWVALGRLVRQVSQVLLERVEQRVQLESQDRAVDQALLDLRVPQAV